MNVRRLLVGALTPLLVAGGVVGLSAPAQAAGRPVLFGSVTDSTTHAPITNIKVSLFDAKFGYLASVKVDRGGVYVLPSSGTGTYHLQFVDTRPAYDTRAYAPLLDVVATTGANGSGQRSVRLHRGGSIGGTVLARGARVRQAAVRAVSDHGHIVNVTSDSKGRYALGGLTNDNYRVFAYDSKKNWVGASKAVRSVRARTYKRASFDLRTRAASFTGGFLTSGGTPLAGSVTVTAVNTTTGEYWVQKVTRGGLNLRGLTAGRYQLKVPDHQGYFGRTFTLGSLRPGQNRRASANLPVRSGFFVGRVVSTSTGLPIKNASVRLIDGTGKTQAELTTAKDGTFHIGDGLTARSNVTIRVFTYDKIDGVMYVPQNRAGLVVANDVAVDLGTIGLSPVPNPVPTPMPTPVTTPTPTAQTPASDVVPSVSR